MSKHQASRNTNQVETPSRSMAKASQKERPTQVQKWDESNCKMRWKQVQNEMKACGKMRRSKSTKTSQETSEVEDLWSPETKDTDRRVSQQTSPKAYWSSWVFRTTMAINNRFSLSRRWSNKLQHEDDRVKNESYQQAKNPLGGSQLRHTEKSTEKSTETSTSQVLPTCHILTGMNSTKKSTKIPLKLPIESATRCRPSSLPRSRPRFYWSCLLRTTRKSTRWSPKRTSKDNNRVNVNYQSLLPARYILQSMRKRCTKAQESAGTHEFGKYKHLSKSLYVRCLLMRRDYTQCNWHIRLTAMTDAGSGSSHQCQVMRGSSQLPWRNRTMTYPEGSEIREWWSLGGWVRKSGYGDGITFRCFLVSLFSSSLLWITARYKWRWHWFLPSTNGGAVAPCARSAQRSPLSCSDRWWDLWVLTIAYVGWLFLRSSLFLSFSLVQFMQPRWSAPKERDNVMAARDCSRVMAILYSRLATRLRSLAIILPIHLFIITRVHICNCIPSITIRMPTRPNAGVRALTLIHGNKFKA